MLEVFADDLRVTVPHEAWTAISGEVASVCEDAGMGPAVSTDLKTLHVVEGGVVRTERMRMVRSVVASGQALARLRAVGLYGRFLAAISAVPHRVTGLHATADVADDASPRLAAVLDRSRSPDGLRAGRKAISARSIERHLREIEGGVDSGTVYCGTRHAEIRPVVYDKRLERLDKGYPDPGPLTRYELRLRNVGATLRDVHDPTAIFWHYMAPDFLPRPEGVADWVAHGEGFVLPRVEPLLPARRLLNQLEGSADLRRLIDMAAGVTGGPGLFRSFLDKRFQVS